TPSSRTRRMAEMIRQDPRAAALMRMEAKAQTSPCPSPAAPLPPPASPDSSQASPFSAPPLPLILTRFFGREQELARLTEILGMGCRVSGVGETEGKGKREKGKEGTRHKAQGTREEEIAIQNPKSKIQNSDPRPPTPHTRLVTLTGPGGAGK